MYHYVTFEDSTTGETGLNQLAAGIDAHNVEFVEIERGGGDPPAHPEEKWITQFFTSSDAVSEDEEERIQKLPGVIDWSFNQESRMV